MRTRQEHSCYRHRIAAYQPVEKVRMGDIGLLDGVCEPKVGQGRYVKGPRLRVSGLAGFGKQIDNRPLSPLQRWSYITARSGRGMVVRVRWEPAGTRRLTSGWWRRAVSGVDTHNPGLATNKQSMQADLNHISPIYQSEGTESASGGLRHNLPCSKRGTSPSGPLSQAPRPRLIVPSHHTGCQGGWRWEMNWFKLFRRRRLSEVHCA